MSHQYVNLTTDDPLLFRLEKIDGELWFVYDPSLKQANGRDTDAGVGLETAGGTRALPTEPGGEGDNPAGQS